MYLHNYPVESVGAQVHEEVSLGVARVGTMKTEVQMKRRPSQCVSVGLPSKLLLAGKAPGKDIVAPVTIIVCGCTQIVWFVYTENRYDVLIT